MSPAGQRHAVAALDGFTNFRLSAPWEVSDPPEERILLCGEHRVFCGERVMAVPHYLEDLNAVQRVVKQLTDEQARRYIYVLWCLYHQLHIDPRDDARGLEFDWSQVLWMLRATPAQHVEAILRACGKWEE